jgi:dihydroorotate dehydrogenase
VGINIGKNLHASDPLQDYIALLMRFYPFASYITINISSPNTPGLRGWQEADVLSVLLQALAEARKEAMQTYERRVPIWVKFAPDITQDTLQRSIALLLHYGMDALVLGNTTTARVGLRSPLQHESGGLSGAPLWARSTALVAHAYAASGGQLPIVAAGGIFTGQDAYAKLLAGASLLQLYTGLVYQGPGCVRRILQDLQRHMAHAGHTSLASAIGCEATSRAQAWPLA